MPRFTPILSLLFFSSFLFTSLYAQHFLRADGRAIVNENRDTILLKGMGLGGWMLQEGYMLQTAGFANAQHQIRANIEALIGEADTDAFYDAWLANHVTETDIDSLQSWGFNSVRLPMHYNLYTLPVEEEPVPGENTWLSSGFELTDSLIAWCKRREMYVILDLHAAPGGQGYDEGISDYDTSKPSLWESAANRAKMVALWKRIAERYVDEQWVAGYDLLNEPNWNLPGGVALRNLYEEVTDSIRSVDTTHILFIEGNWFANDFTGLTPPWDDNLVYSPHKYWSFNDKATMQWVLDIRNNLNVPLYLGESGENSNVWFRDAIKLMEELEIGWAWWPMKKIESIAGPLSVVKTPGYQALLDYWNGTGPEPSAEAARAALMEIAEGLKIENCVYQKDVIDAMFRQVQSDEAVPFRTQAIPGVVFASDFDMGVVGSAYYDNEVANYQVSTGNFTSWNNGWVYRNDGVDLEICTDNVNTNGYNAGWLATGEWMQYDVAVAAAGVYDISVRTASGADGGRLHFAVGEAAVTPSVSVPGTGDWQNWQTTVIPGVILTPEDRKLKFHVDAEGFNVSSFAFVDTGVDPATVATSFVSAVTTTASSIRMNVNKLLSASLPSSPGDFTIYADGSAVPITAITLDADNPRIIHFSLDYTLSAAEDLKISYGGNQVFATDGTALSTFTLENVENTVRIVHQLPGRIQAEDFFNQFGVSLETTSDAGGGQNIGFLDPGDYLDYEIDVTVAGTYRVEYRTASETAQGQVEMHLLDAAGNATVLGTPSFPQTGGWQTWTTTSGTLELPAGKHVLRMRISRAPFNMNWMDFTLPTSTTERNAELSRRMSIFPNPTGDDFTVSAAIDRPQQVQLLLADVTGKEIMVRTLEATTRINARLSVSGLPSGVYYLLLRLEDGRIGSQRLIKR